LKDGKLVGKNSKRRPSVNDDLVETIYKTGLFCAKMFCRTWLKEDNVFKGTVRMMLFLGLKLELLQQIKLESLHMRHSFATLLCHCFILDYGREMVYVLKMLAWSIWCKESE
jgi:hypothetical protein